MRIFWLHQEEWSSLEPQLLQLNQSGFNIYAGVNPRSCRASKESSVAKVVAFHADVDGCGSATKSPQEKRAPTPSVVIDSGHGRHLYWHLAQPVTVTEANRAHLKGINRGLALAVEGDPACCDLSRILRVPGFINHKLPPAKVRLLESNGIHYTQAEFEPFAVERPESSQSNTDLNSIPSLSDDLKRRFHEARVADKSHDLTRAWRGEIGDGSSDSRYVLARGLTKAGFAQEEIAAIVCSRRWYNRKKKQPRSCSDVLRDVKYLLSKSS